MDILAFHENTALHYKQYRKAGCCKLLSTLYIYNTSFDANGPNALQSERFVLLYNDVKVDNCLRPDLLSTVMITVPTWDQLQQHCAIRKK